MSIGAAGDNFQILVVAGERVVVRFFWDDIAVPAGNDGDGKESLCIGAFRDAKQVGRRVN